MFFGSSARDLLLGGFLNRKSKKPRWLARLLHVTQKVILLDLAFFVLDMLAHHRVVLFDDHLFGHRACVLFGHVEVASTRGRVQADLNCGRLRHWSSPARAADAREISM